MSLEVERLEGELRGLRLENEALRADNYALRAKLSRCTCGASTDAPPAAACDERQLDLVEQAPTTDH